MKKEEDLPAGPGPDIESILEEHGHRKRHVLSMLHQMQEETEGNYIREKDLRKLAEKLEMPFSNLHSVVTFYSMYSIQPRGKYIIRVCESGPCTLLGADTVFEVIEDELNVGLYETTEDGLFTLEPSSCLGICGVAPAMMINDETYGNLTPEKIRKVLAELKEEEKEGVVT